MYPKAVGKQLAWKAWQLSVKTPEDIVDIEIALKNYKAVAKEPYIQYGSTWFNNWRDWFKLNGPVGQEGSEWTTPSLTRR